MGPSHTASLPVGRERPHGTHSRLMSRHPASSPRCSCRHLPLVETHMMQHAPWSSRGTAHLRISHRCLSDTKTTKKST